MVCMDLSCISLTAAVIGIVTAIYFYVNRNFKTWQSLGINGPKPIPLFGNMLTFFTKTWPEVEMEWYRKYGKIYGVYTGNTPGLTIGDPELIKMILVKDFHNFRDRRPNPSTHKIFSKVMVNAPFDDWKRIRAIASPTFTSGKMKKMYPLIDKCVNDFTESLDDYAKERKEIDLKKIHGAYTMDVIAKCAFATTTNTHKDPDNAFVKNAYAIFNIPPWRALFVFILPMFIMRIQFIRRMLMGSSNSEFFIDVAQHLINERKVNKEKHNDFLQLLMDAERGSDDSKTESELETNESHHVHEGSDEKAADSKAFSNVIEKKLTENEILAQCVLFFIAGYETTASTLSFCSYELAIHPNVQEKLYEEIKNAEDENGVIGYEKLSKLPFLDAVLSETLRMFPPALRLSRMAMEDYKLGDTGITIPKGTIAEIPVYALHHDPDYYENPHQFNPNRFMPENRENIKPYTYLPFGAGPRNCIGMRFALLEAKLALTKIIRKFRFFRSENTDVPLVFVKGRRLLQAKGYAVGIERR